ncbi:unnamed protein product [Linum trigynum]|uniref:Uncharacterized protein n=1 Tax=Linum trigynum TaxID=586398 RepID=A0AAV2CYB3_9ROSI
MIVVWTGIRKRAGLAVSSDPEKWLVLMWFLWKKRNAQVHNGQKMEENQIAVRAESFLKDYQDHQDYENNMEAIAHATMWSRPPAQTTKINLQLGVVIGWLSVCRLMPNYCHLLLQEKIAGASATRFAVGWGDNYSKHR